MRSHLARSWINAKLAPGKSRIHGVGVLAVSSIGCGEKLMEFGGLAITRADIDTDLYRTRSIWLFRSDIYLALPENDPEQSLDENLNHSCDANSWLDDEVTLSAKRDIAAGEEITLDQGTWNFDEDEYVWDQDHCSCGSPHCRRTLAPKDWMLAEVQERYRGHFHPHVQLLIDAGKVRDRAVSG
jgi:hypothetical protein